MRIVAHVLAREFVQRVVDFWRDFLRGLTPAEFLLQRDGVVLKGFYRLAHFYRVLFGFRLAARQNWEQD